MRVLKGSGFDHSSTRTCRARPSGRPAPLAPLPETLGAELRGHGARSTRRAIRQSGSRRRPRASIIKVVLLGRSPSKIGRAASAGDGARAAARTARSARGRRRSAGSTSIASALARIGRDAMAGSADAQAKDDQPLEIQQLVDELRVSPTRRPKKRSSAKKKRRRKRKRRIRTARWSTSPSRSSRSAPDKANYVSEYDTKVDKRDQAATGAIMAAAQGRRDAAAAGAAGGRRAERAAAAGAAGKGGRPGPLAMRDLQDSRSRAASHRRAAPPIATASSRIRGRTDRRSSYRRASRSATTATACAARRAPKVRRARRGRSGPRSCRRRRCCSGPSARAAARWTT